MKKLALSLAVLFSVALVSCGGNKAENCDSDTCAMDTVVAVEVAEVVDSANDTAVAAEAVEAVAPAAEVENAEAAK